MTGAQGYYGTKTYTYDAYGNITGKDGMVYSYPAVGGVQPHAVTSDGTNTYAYDVNGNMTTGKGRTLTYNTENRVTQITKDGVTTMMSYDDSGERITKTVGTTVTVYWFGSYEERYTSGSLSEATKYYSANGQPVAQRSTVSGLLYIHRDHLGSVSKLTNASGVVVQTMEYIPYGTKTYASGGEYTDYGYTGQENDPSTGLYYFHARYYDPELGRFMQADTVLDGVNRYTYCGNNPIYYVDPSGKMGDAAALAAAEDGLDIPDSDSPYGHTCPTEEEVAAGVDSGDSSGDPGTGGASTAGGTGNPPGTGNSTPTTQTTNSGQAATAGNGSGHAITVTEGAVHLDNGHIPTRDAGVLDPTSLADEAYDVYEDVTGEELDIDPCSLVLEIFVHAIIETGLNALGLSLENTQVTDCGERGADGNRSIWDVLSHDLYGADSPYR